MKNILSKYVGQVVAMYLPSAAENKAYTLKGTGEDFFSVVAEGKSLLVHIPYSRICSIVESSSGEGVSAAFGFDRRVVGIVITLEDMGI